MIAFAVQLLVAQKAMHLTAGVQRPATCLHVLFQLVPPLQVVHIALDGHVVQAEQAVEPDAKSIHQLLLKGSLQSSILFSKRLYD